MRQAYVLLSVAAVLGCHAPRASAPAATVRIAIHRDPIAFLPLRAAEALGYYKAEGVSVELTELGAGTQAIEAMVGGSVDIAAGTISDAIALAATGRDVRGFIVLYDRPTAAVAVAPALRDQVHSVTDLKGRTVGVSAPGSASHQLLNYLLVRNGVSPEEVSTVSVGMTRTSIAALEHGQVDAAVLVASAVTAFERRQPGNRFLADTRTPAGARLVFGSESFPSLSLLAPDRWLRDHRDTAARLVRAVIKGMRWVREQPAAQVRELLPEDARMDRETDLDAIREAQHALSVDGRVPPGSAELIERFVAVSDTRVRPLQTDITRVYTNEFTSSK